MYYSSKLNSEYLIKEKYRKRNKMQETLEIKLIFLIGRKEEESFSEIFRKMSLSLYSKEI